MRDCQTNSCLDMLGVEANVQYEDYLIKIHLYLTLSSSAVQPHNLSVITILFLCWWEQCARVTNVQWAMCKGLQSPMSNVQGSPHPDESESGVRRWAERSSHSYKLNCTIQQAEQPKEVKWNAMQRTDLRFSRTCLFNCTFLYSSYTILDTRESTRIILS